MQRSKLSYVIILAGLLVLLFPFSALADAAPPGVPDGENINPGEGTTMVQMVAEEVIIDVGLTREVYLYYSEENYLDGYIVAYNCTFRLVNQGTETENLAVRFPINNYYEEGKIKIQSIKVNDQPVSWVEDDIDNMNLYNWAHFDVVFPPGEEIEIKITYTTVTAPYGNRCWVSYILETGAGWYGPIEKGRIILRLPYQATSENVTVSDYTTSEAMFNESDVYWDFTDLEPTSDDNFGVGIVEPDLWLEIIAERNRLEDSPNNFSALYRLAEYISAATIWEDYEVRVIIPALYEEGLEAIKKALSLNPGDVQSHELYTWYLRADNSMESHTLMLEEVDIILELDPENSTAESILRQIEISKTATARANATNPPPRRPIPPESEEPNIPTPTRKLVQDSSPTITPTQLVAPEIQEAAPTENPNNALGIILIPTLIILLLLGGIAAIRAMNRK